MIGDSKGSDSFSSTSAALKLVMTGKVMLLFFELLAAVMPSLLSWLFLSLNLVLPLVDGDPLSTLGRLPVRLKVELLSSGFGGCTFYQEKV